MKTHAHLMKRREIRDAPHVRDAARVHDGRADVVDELRFDEVLAIPDGIEHLAYCKRRHGVAADDLERLLILRGCRVLEPEEPIRLERTPETRGFDRREA